MAQFGQSEIIAIYAMLRDYPFLPGIMARTWEMERNAGHVEGDVSIAATAILWSNLSRAMPSELLPRVRLASNDARY